MASPPQRLPRIPAAPRAIQKGLPLKHLLGTEAVDCLAQNISLVHPEFETRLFRRTAVDGLECLELMQRGQHIATALRRHLPAVYREAIGIILDSLTPMHTDADEFGLAEFFYLPHSFYISNYGTDRRNNGGIDTFETSMTALYELTTHIRICNPHLPDSASRS